MHVLVACERFGEVRRAFRDAGHIAWSCDILPAVDESEWHIKANCLDYINNGWDLIIAFPPCTYLTNMGNAWNGIYPERAERRREALAFVQAIMDADCPKIAVENPRGAISVNIRQPDQIIQPWYFGEPYVKATHLWLKGLPKLKPTNLLEAGRTSWIFGQQNKELRDRTFRGIALAMASQWGVD